MGAIGIHGNSNIPIFENSTMLCKHCGNNHVLSMLGPEVTYLYDMH